MANKTSSEDGGLSRGCVVAIIVVALALLALWIWLTTRIPG
jgi:hypothetical protein